MKLRRTRTGHITLDEARSLFVDLMGGAEVVRTRFAMMVAWHAFRIGIAIAQRGKVSSVDVETIRLHAMPPREKAAHRAKLLDPSWIRPSVCCPKCDGSGVVPMPEELHETWCAVARTRGLFSAADICRLQPEVKATTMNNRLAALLALGLLASSGKDGKRKLFRNLAAVAPEVAKEKPKGAADE